MKLSLDDPRPAYVQIADGIRVDIEAGRLKPGERLPSGRELAKEYGTALMTVQNALRLLRERGLVVSHQGRGVFVRDSPGDERTGAAPGDWADTRPVAEQLAEVAGELRHLSERVAHLEKVTGVKRPG
jgi:GntR family transcriptional regulator